MILVEGFGPGLLMYGHSFAMEREHDQAMNSYMKAAKVMRGCHLPLLYIGLEYSMTNNHKLAEKFFQEALTVAPKDPHVLHELAVLEFRSDRLAEAERLIRTALTLLDEVHGAMLPTTWEPLVNNMAHICRKQKKYDEALEFHRKVNSMPFVGHYGSKLTVLCCLGTATLPQKSQYSWCYGIGLRT